MASKKKRERHRTSTRPTPRPPSRGPANALDDFPHLELLTGIDEALRDPHPLALLTFASTLVSVLDRRGAMRFGRNPEPELPTLAEIADSFDDLGLRQTDALLKVIAELSGDDVLRARIRRAVAERKHPIPGWLLRLDQIRPHRAALITEVLGDGNDIVIGVTLPGKRECSIVVYIDHNMGTLVKDAFVLDRAFGETLEAWTGIETFGNSAISEISLADARAHTTQAVDLGAITFPPFESDTWPACRPLVEWIVSMMIEGGVGYVRPEWSDKQRRSLAKKFFASEFGLVLDDDDHSSLLESILWFGTDYGPGDPLRWSPISVEILLEDWIPRKLVAPEAYLAKAPGLLRAYVRYCHAERGIPSELTTETLAAIDVYEPGYQKVIRTPRHQGPMAILERMGDLDGIDSDRGGPFEPDLTDSHEPDWADSKSLAEFMLASFAEEVGGAEILEHLSTEPLPDEAFDWAGIANDIHARVTEVLELVDRCSDALFNIEFRTAARRFLARVALADANIFRRKGRRRPRLQLSAG